MTKKIRNITIGEALEICLHNDCKDCPLHNDDPYDYVSCPLEPHAYATKTEYLDKEIEI